MLSKLLRLFFCIPVFVLLTLSFSGDISLSQEQTPDTSVMPALRKAVHKSQGELIPTDFEYLTTFTASKGQITDIMGLEMAVNLTELDLSGNAISDLTPISALNKLVKLNLNTNQVVDLTPLKNLTNLRELYLNNNQISDITPLASLANLTKLQLDGNQITPLHYLSDLKNLEELRLNSNRIIDIEPLIECTNLKILALDGNGILNITPVAQLKKLEYLSLDGVPVNNLAPFSGLLELRYLAISLEKTQQGSITDLSQLSRLTKLENLFIANQAIRDINAISNCPNLMKLNLKNNKITNINAILSNKNLKSGCEIILEGNPLGKIAIEEQLPALQKKGIQIRFRPDIDAATAQIEEKTVIDTPQTIAQSEELKKFMVPGSPNLSISLLDVDPEIESLDLTENILTDITGLAKFKKLKELKLNNPSFTDISQIQKLPQIKSLNLMMSGVKDLTGLSYHPGIESLDLSYTSVSDLSPLKTLSKLKKLTLLMNPRITDPSPLTECKSLETVVFDTATPIDFKTLARIPNLKDLTFAPNLPLAYLDISVDYEAKNSQFEKTGKMPSNRFLEFDLKGIENCANLERLDLSSMTMINYENIGLLTNLRELILEMAEIDNVKPLASLVNLEKLDLNYTKVSDVTPLASLPKLKTLFLDSSKVTDLSPFVDSQNFKSLESLNLNHIELNNEAYEKHIAVLDKRGVNFTVDDPSKIKRQPSDIPAWIKSEIPDVNLLRAIQRELNTQSMNFQKSQLDQIDSLWLDEDIANLKGIQLCKNIKEIYVSVGKNKDFSPLASLALLEKIQISFPNKLDIGFISNCRNLKMINVIGKESSNRSANTKPVRPGIKDYSPLAKLPKLEDVSFSNLVVPDISILSKCKSLKNLSVFSEYDNEINFGSIGKINSLQKLSIHVPNMADITSIGNLSNLRELSITFSSLNSIKPLSKIAGSLIRLDLKYNDIRDISALGRAYKLQYLNLEHNKIVDIKTLENLVNLKEINLEINEIKDISPLANFTRGNWAGKIQMSGNNVRDISPLLSKPKLVPAPGSAKAVCFIDLNSNLVSEADVRKYTKQLEERNVILKAYSPRDEERHS